MDPLTRPSPWSTPRKSEYGEGFIELNEEFVDLTLTVRELGDGEPSVDLGQEDGRSKSSMKKTDEEQRSKGSKMALINFSHAKSSRSTERRRRFVSRTCINRHSFFCRSPVFVLS